MRALGFVFAFAAFSTALGGLRDVEWMSKLPRPVYERNPKGRVGVENYRFGDVICSVVATTDEIRVKSNKSFILLADGRKFTVSIGERSFARICSAGANSNTVGGL